MSTPDCKTKFEDTQDSDLLRHINSTLDWERDPRLPLAKLQRLVLAVPNGPKLTIIPGQKLTVGRTAESDHIVSNDHHISRQHFSIECDSGVATLEDEQSTNGTFLNGIRVQSATLADRDRITAGLTTFFVRLVF